MDTMGIALVFWLGVVVCTAVIAYHKGRNPFTWFVLGLLFGIFTLLVVVCIPVKRWPSIPMQSVRGVRPKDGRDYHPRPWPK